jgi:hypothetical protein
MWQQFLQMQGMMRTMLSHYRPKHLPNHDHIRLNQVTQRHLGLNMDRRRALTIQTLPLIRRNAEETQFMTEMYAGLKIGSVLIFRENYGLITSYFHPIFIAVLHEIWL